MNSKKLSKLIFASTAALAYFASPECLSAATTSFGINFAYESGQSILAGRTGLLGAAEWFDVCEADKNNPVSGTEVITLSDTNAISVSYSAANTYDNGWGNTYGNGTTTFYAAGAFRNYLDDGGSGITITLSGLSDWMTAGGFDGYTITILSGSDNTLTSFATIYYSDGIISGTITPDTVYNGSWDGYVTNQEPYGGTRAMTVSGDIITDEDSLTITSSRGTYRGSIAGVIITGVVIPEPSTYAMFGGIAAAGIALVARRRKRN